MKRKWSLRDESVDMEAELPLCLWLGGSSSSSDSKASSATMSSPKKTDELESSMDLELDFSLHIGGKKVSTSNKPSLDLQNQFDLELTFSSTPTSSITSLSRITHHHQRKQQQNINSKICQFNGCVRVRHGGGKRCKYEGCGKSAQGSSDFCKVHGGLVEDERVHGGATLGPLVHDTFDDNDNDMNVDTSVVMTSRVTERRVHGGSLIAFLRGCNSGGLLDSEKVNMMPQKWI